MMINIQFIFREWFQLNTAVVHYNEVVLKLLYFLVHVFKVICRLLKCRWYTIPTLINIGDQMQVVYNTNFDQYWRSNAGGIQYQL